MKEEVCVCVDLDTPLSSIHEGSDRNVHSFAERHDRVRLCAPGRQDGHGAMHVAADRLLLFVLKWEGVSAERRTLLPEKKN
ncbi:hypothetical protein MRX96_053704 [Rhipicephalus microplus]